MAITLDGTNGGTASAGWYAKAPFTGTYTNGIVIDYTTGVGRISVGSSDGLTIYNGGIANTTLAKIDSSGNLFTNGGTVPVSRIVQSTAQATTSGSAVGFTGIPSWAKKITFQLNGVVYSQEPAIQVGSGSYSTSGYSGSSAYISSGTANQQYTNGWGILASSTGIIVGQLIITNMGSNTWVGNGMFSAVGATPLWFTNSKITLSGALDRIQITTPGGAFSAGTVNIMYEG